MLQLPERLIHRQIEGVHHAVFALVDDPERLAADVEELGVAVISAGSVSDLKLLVG